MSANSKQRTPAPGTLSGQVVISPEVDILYLFVCFFSINEDLVLLYGTKVCTPFHVEDPQLPPLYLKHKNKTYSNFKINDNMYFKKLRFLKGTR